MLRRLQNIVRDWKEHLIYFFVFFSCSTLSAILTSMQFNLICSHFFKHCMYPSKLLIPFTRSSSFLKYYLSIFVNFGEKRWFRSPQLSNKPISNMGLLSFIFLPFTKRRCFLFVLILFLISSVVKRSSFPFLFSLYFMFLFSQTNCLTRQLFQHDYLIDYILENNKNVSLYKVLVLLFDILCILQA